jgi:long-chain acyl-CoA synthetase
LITDAEFRSQASAAIARTETPSLKTCIRIGGAAPGFLDYEAFIAASSDKEPDEQMLGGPMFYTSGTTGRPKGVRASAGAAPPPIEMMAMQGAAWPICCRSRPTA